MWGRYSFPVVPFALALIATSLDWRLGSGSSTRMASLRVREFESTLPSSYEIFINLSQVGFDLVNVQFSSKLLEPSVASRVQWKHGNL